MKPPVPREEVLNLYWYFASERQQVFERRVGGAQAPWTEDRILQSFKFCNVFRASDRVSQYLIRDVAYGVGSVDPADKLFQILAFRLFSRIETWRSICKYLGRAPIVDDLRDSAFLDALDFTRSENRTLYTGAFILCATDAYGQRIKHRNHVELLRHMFVRNRMAQEILEAASLRAVVDILLRYPLIGDFMSYQIAIDLNYSEHLGFSENDCVIPGPGAIRGLRKAFVTLGDLTPAETIMWMVDQQEEQFTKRGFSRANLWGRPLHAIDCQGLFCEVDKYCREALPELRSARTRIKARFRPSAEMLNLFFPPKWRLNERLPKYVAQREQQRAVG